MKSLLVVSVALLVVPGLPLSASEPAPRPGDTILKREMVVLRGLDGDQHVPLNATLAKAHVLIFTTTDCPIANSYAPEIKRLVEHYTAKQVRFFLVHVDRNLGTEAAKSHRAEYGYELPVLIDRNHELVTTVGATVTPEVAVIDPRGKLVYRGCIDDLFAQLGQKRQQPRQRYLRQSLDELLSSRPISQPRTKAVGCFIQFD